MKEIVLRSGKKIKFTNTKIMGIINMTPNSFYKPSRFTCEEAYKKVISMIEQGVDIIDIGGESTHPDNKPISIDEELTRVIPIIKKIKNNLDCILSIDTYNEATAKEAIKYGVDIINDISGLTFDDNMLELAVKTQTPIVLMHYKKSNLISNKKQKNDIVEEINLFFKEKIELLLQKGFSKNKIILDPGISFGKNLEENIKIIKNINKFKELNFPLLYGISRKGFLAKLAKCENEEVKFIATLGINEYLMRKNVDIIRVHDIFEHRIIRKITEDFSDNLYSIGI